jgi:hypothetical protein
MSQLTTFGSSGGAPTVLTLTGNSGGPVGPTVGNINILGTGSITVVGNPGTSTLTITPSGSLPISFPTDSGTATPAAGILRVLGGTSGRDINTSGSGNTIHTDLNNTITLGDLSAVAANTPSLTLTTGDIDITAGNITMPFTNAAGSQGAMYVNGNLFLNTLGIGNVFMGIGASNLTFNTGLAAANIGFGTSVMSALTTGAANAAFGYNNLTSLTTGGSNTSLGSNGLGFLVSGSSNVAIGAGAGQTYTTNESDNILISSLGVILDSGTIRIGTNGIQTKSFICGIDGVNVGSVAKIVTMASDQLGTATITAGTGITVTPSANTITISASGIVTFAYTNVSTTPYVVLVTDDYISVDASGGVITIQLPNAATLGKTFIIKDRMGSAASNNITVTTVGGAVNIDAATTFVMNTAYQSINVIGNGSFYEIF